MHKNDNNMLLMRQSQIEIEEKYLIIVCLFVFRWILSYFRSADKDRSGTLTKRECRRLLTDSLNAKVPEDVFEKLFRVKSIENLSISFNLVHRKQINPVKVFSLPMNS